SNFTEGILIDYRHFDARDIVPLYEFGFELNYTMFDLVSDLVVELLTPGAPNLPTAQQSINSTNELYTPPTNATVRVSNSGDRDGTTAVQLYIPPRPELLSVPSGATLVFFKGPVGSRGSSGFTFELSQRNISYWGTSPQMWRIPAGQLQFQAGFSSRNLPRSAELAIL
ncbi:hypothetical protein GQ53DRAFT_664023, partial [Thozetella sp. PMI_491]